MCFLKALAPKNTATTRTPSQFTRPRIVVTITQAQLTAGVTKSTIARTAILCSWRNALILFISPPFTKMNERTPVGARLSNLSATHKRKTPGDCPEVLLRDCSVARRHYCPDSKSVALKLPSHKERLRVPWIGPP